jgi:hypothetical protein
MADRPLNISRKAALYAMQSPPTANLIVSVEGEPVTLAANEQLDVRGIAYVLAYGGGVVSATYASNLAAVPLHDTAGVAVVVGTSKAQLVETRGVHYLSFANTAVVVTSA